MDSSGNEFLDAALYYASLGWRVMPLYPRGKMPWVKDWGNNATTDESIIRGWWQLQPQSNVGILTGNGLCVIDVDDKPEKHGGLLGSDFLRDWELEHADISETVCAKSGTGGMHYYFDVGDAKIPGCQSDTIFIDIRCDGNLIVAPPSIHPDTGLPYVWDISPEDMLPAKVTDNDKACIKWIYDNRRGADKDGNREKVKVPKEKVKDGEGRNNFLYDQGCSARAKGSDDDMIYAWLTSLNQMKCNPPLDESELNKIIHSVCKLPIGLSDEAKELQQQKKSPGRPRKFEHNKVARKLIDEYGACLIDGETPAIRINGRYRVGWDAFDNVVIEMHDDCTVNNRREVKAYIQAKAPNKKQSSPYLIAFQNGVLDIRTMELRDYADDDIIPNIIPHNWNPDARGEVLENTLYKMACGDIATYLNLAEFIGVCMIRSAKLCPFFPVLVGVGSNGKSTYIELIKDVVGMENISGLQPKEIAAHFLASHIVGKTANLGDDISSGYLDEKDCSIIKSIATGDLMFTDVKGGKGFHFQPYCTMVFSCNQFPRLADTTPGFMRRLFPVEFNAIFSADDPDYDPMIGEKLREEEVLERACVIGVEGLLRVIEQRRPTPNEMSESMKGEIASEGNTALMWIHDEAITQASIIGKTKDELYERYTSWCDRNGYKKTALGSGALKAQLGTIFRVRLSKIEHREYADGRKTVRVFELIVPNVPKETPDES